MAFRDVVVEHTIVGLRNQTIKCRADGVSRRLHRLLFGFISVEDTSIHSALEFRISRSAPLALMAFLATQLGSVFHIALARGPVDATIPA